MTPQISEAQWRHNREEEMNAWFKALPFDGKLLLLKRTRDDLKAVITNCRELGLNPEPFVERCNELHRILEKMGE